MKTRKKRLCPQCKSGNIVAIVYGLPTEPLMGDAKKGRVILGGCCIDGRSPAWKCKNCGRTWGKVHL